MRTITKCQDGKALTMAQELARDIAPALGKGWRFAQPRESYPTGYIKSSDGHELAVFIISHGAQAGKATVLGCFRDRNMRDERLHSAKHQIGFAVNRPVAAIARDIEKRLMPGYREEFARVVASVEESNADIARAESTIAALARAAPDVVWPRTPHPHDRRPDGTKANIRVAIGDDDYAISGELRVNTEGQVFFEVRNVPANLAEAMLKVLTKAGAK